MADEDHTSAPPLQRLEVYTTNPDLPPCVGRSKTAPPLSWIRADPVFRDATHHFLRLFDQMFTKFAEAASDA